MPPIEWKISRELIPYEDAVALMEERVVDICNGDKPELIWFLQHPSIYTCGTSANQADILAQDRCPIYKTGRGGQVTYHGPGQLIAYVMIDLKQRGPDLRQYVKNLEEWIIQTLSTYNIKALRRDGRVGLWVPRNETTDDKIAAIGVRVKKWVTLHGLSLNISPDLSFYNGIVPCGISTHGVTSMQKLGMTQNFSEISQRMKSNFTNIF